jgi:F420H(2)-dependent quinone reductase
VRPERTARLTRAAASIRRPAVLGSRIHAALYRRTGGRILPRWFSGAPVMVLETVGRKSGEPRSTPILYAERGGDLIVMPANAGDHRTPAWWLNLRDAGDATVVIKGERRRIRPRLARDDEYADLWKRYLEVYPPGEKYLAFTDREIPLVVLEPVDR